MKKIIVPIFSCILVGFLFGKIMFNQYNSDNTIKTSVSDINSLVYFIQVGAYSTIDNMKEAMKDTTNYVYMQKDNKYYAFVGMTKEKNNVDKLKKYFEEQKYSVYIKEIVIDNSSFLDVLSQYDLLLNEAESNESISTIEKSVLAKYEELNVQNKGNSD